MVAEERGCDFFGIELNPEYARHATDRILTARAQRLGEADRSGLKDTVALVPSDDDHIVGTSFRTPKPTR